MIVDSHMHLFPDLSSASGFTSIEEHLRGLQRQSYYNVNPTRRKADQSIVAENHLWDGTDPGVGGLTDVGFRVGPFGTQEWEVDGEEYYVQLFAPSLQTNASSPEYILAEMNYAGVDVAVIQQGPTYGRLNSFSLDCMTRFPDRFVGLAQIAEETADTDESLEELQTLVSSGFKGLFYSQLGFWESGGTERADAVKYESFWDAVRSAGLVVFWDQNSDVSGRDGYLDQLGQLARILERVGPLPIVVVQAFPIGTFAPDMRYELPPILHELAALESVLFELAYPISYGGTFEYPYTELLPLIQQLYDWFGPEKLVWGSDMPNVLRYCTYKQSLQYLSHCPILSRDDLALISGGNLARAFSLEEPTSKGPSLA